MDTVDSLGATSRTKREFLVALRRYKSTHAGPQLAHELHPSYLEERVPPIKKVEATGKPKIGQRTACRQTGQRCPGEEGYVAIAWRRVPPVRQMPWLYVLAVVTLSANEHPEARRATHLHNLAEHADGIYCVLGDFEQRA
jgi:hypothetical protein